MTQGNRRPWENIYPAGVTWDQEIPARPLHTLLEDTQRRFGSRPAFDFLGKRQNWNQIADTAWRVARGLQDLGIGKGDKVGLFLPNSPCFVSAYFGIARSGATIVNLNPLYAEREIAHLIENGEIDTIITADLSVLIPTMVKMLAETRLNRVIVARFAEMLPFPKNLLFPVLRAKDICAPPEGDSRFLPFSDLVRNPAPPDPVEINPTSDIALLQYTGGTTGRPKGAMLTHANVVSNVEQIALWFHEVPDGEEKMLGVLPFFHVFAMTAVMNTAVRKGMEIIALPRFDLKQTLDLIHKKKPTLFPGVPAIYTAINAFPGLDRYDLTSLKYCISGGAPLPVDVKTAFEKKTGCILVEGYGLTETSPVVCVNPIRGENRTGSIGLPLPGTDLRIEGAEPGELCIRGPQVMAGYWNAPEETAAVLRDGWLHTGDVAVMDPDGYIRIVDRIKDMIITNGYNVYPRNVEEAIYLHPSVEECIVAGIPDERRGELVKAWVKPGTGKTLTEQDLKDFLKDKLSPMEIPRRFEFRNAPLPKTLIGKLSRKDVLAQEENP